MSGQVIGQVTRRMRWNRMLAGLAALVLALLALAWVDGGRVPLRELSEPVAVPGAAR